MQEEKRELEVKRLEMDRKEQEHQEKVESEERERLEKERKAKEEQRQEQHKTTEEQNKPGVPIRGRRAARRTTTSQPEQDAALSTDDVPARRTRSRSNSSNSVSSERSAPSINTQGNRGRGRGRGVKRASEPAEAAVARSSNRRRTVAAGSLQQESSPLGLRSRSNSSNSLNSEVSSCSVGFQVRGRGGRQRGRGRKTEADSTPSVIGLSNHNSTPKPAARGQKGKKREESSNDVFQEEDKEKADCQLAAATRGRQQPSENASEPAALENEDQTNREACHASEDSPQSKRNVRVRAVASESVVTPGPAGGQTKDKRIGRKRVMVENTEEGSSNSSKVAKGKQKVQTTETKEEKGNDETKDENIVQVKRRGRASSAQGKKNGREFPPKVELQEEKIETVEKRKKGRPSAVQSKKKEVQDDNTGTSFSSMSPDAKVATSQPQTRTGSVSRKRQTSSDSSPMAKTPRSSSASPAASGRLRVASQSYKVLFTGVVDEEGERVLARLGGSMAKGVADMNCLVTDKVRRTVKFLCAVAKGIPIVTTHWLEKSGKAGSFLPPDAFVVKDPEQEKKFSFCLQDSLRTASSQPLLRGYEIHVTKSVKPEPVQMKDILSCSGAIFLPRMPSTHKPQTVVISCEEDWLLCGPAVSASLPVLTAEFILTGILQQKLDFQSYTLSASTANLQPAGGRGRSRKKT
ncbi:hypothetical protein Q5P01_011434 [Channa striata]|uniref:BRCT domain-containing protein n=1 Tax=Channa striata TaxID=64152 RepID=A0AA88MWX3_CHASR|nr:hypothetical protein Q5P01_011434 [Channa striata]